MLSKTEKRKRKLKRTLRRAQALHDSGALEGMWVRLWNGQTISDWARVLCLFEGGGFMVEKAYDDFRYWNVQDVAYAAKRPRR